MNSKRFSTMVLAASMAVSLTACSGADANSNSSSTSEGTTAASQNTTTASTTSASTTKPAEPDIPDIDVNGEDCVIVNYGWDIDDTDCMARIYCPEGAEFDDYTLQVQADNGWVLTADVSDEVNEYSATSISHWHRDAHSYEPTYYPIIAQLYFDGGIDDVTAEDYNGCSQKVTPLGFKWEGKDVVLIETTYTFKDYYEQTDLFVGVEYPLNYWKVDETTGDTSDLTTKGLFGFDIYSYSWGDQTRDKCAWIAGGLFGVDPGLEDPFAQKDTESDAATADIDPAVLIGTWCDKESSWEDTYFFDYEGYGSYTSGFENTFTYSVDGDILTVFYAEDDIDIFTVKFDGETLVLVDEYEYEQRFEKVAEETDTGTEPDNDAEDDINPNETDIIGTWTENDTGYNETFTFYDDGTGYYSSLSEDGTYECGFTYDFFSSDYIDIYYDDGDVGGFLIAIDGNEMTVRNDYIGDMIFTRR